MRDWVRLPLPSPVISSFAAKLAGHICTVSSTLDVFCSLRIAEDSPCQNHNRALVSLVLLALHGRLKDEQLADAPLLLDLNHNHL